MKCSGKFYGMQVSMAKESGDFWKLIFTKIAHNTTKEKTRPYFV